jgi:hypothetical protein
LIGGHLARPTVLDKLEADLLALLEALHAGALKRAYVNENVLRAIIRLNEAETLLHVEPFDYARFHQRTFLE